MPALGRAHSARRAHRRLPAAVALTLALAAFPLGTLASHDFADVPDSNPFHADISALAASGVTTGCGGGNYCPSAFVTREQMAAFMNRLGALAPGKTPVVNADLLDGMDSTALIIDQVVTSQNGPFLLVGGPLTIEHLSYVERISAASLTNGEIVMRVAAPREFSANRYGLQTLQLCWYGGATNVLITSISVFDLSGADTLTTPLSDGIDVDPTSAAGCTLLITPGQPAQTGGSITVSISLAFTAAGHLDISNLLFKWEIGTIPG